MRKFYNKWVFLIINIILLIFTTSCVSLPKQYKILNEIKTTKSIENVINILNQFADKWGFIFEISKPSTDIVLLKATEVDVVELQKITYSSWDGLHIGRQMSDCGKLGLLDVSGVAQKVDILIKIQELNTGSLENNAVSSVKEDSLSSKVRIQLKYHSPYRKNSDVIECVSNGVLEKMLIELIKN